MNEKKAAPTGANKVKSKNALQGGIYSLSMVAVVLAVLIAVNVFVNTLPTTWTKLDMSSAQLYSITSNTKVVLNQLEKDVTIYWIVQADAEDDILENLLGKYESLSDHIDVVKKNPDVFPTFTDKYTEETVPNNSLIVECGSRYRYISNEEIYEYVMDSYSYTYYADSFDGEGALTSAIDYVVSDDLPELYFLEGHGEAELPAIFAEQIEKDNMIVNSLSLLSLEAVPEEVDCVVIYAPTSDISETERDMLLTYVTGGGKLMVMAGPAEADTSMENLYGLLENYGVSVAEGMIVETDYNYYFYGYPQLLLPDMNSHGITDSLIEDKYYVIMSSASGLMVSDDNGTGTVKELLTTSDSAISKLAGRAITSFEKEEGDIEGPFATAVSIEDESGGGLVWFASGDFLEDLFLSYSSGANGDLAMNALSSLIGESEAMAIRSKSLNYNYLTISASDSSSLKLWMIGIVPVAYFAIGLVVFLRKRSLQK